MQLSAFPFSTILFDLDGTLVDSAPDVLEAITAVLRDAGDPVPRMELSLKTKISYPHSTKCMPTD